MTQTTMAFCYPQVPGSRRTDTSRKAAESVESDANIIREQCFRALQRYNGTADEVASFLGESILTIRPRISELRAQGKIIDTGLRRKNASGKSAIVWRAL